MSTLFDMISAFIAFLISAALAHFGGAIAPHSDLTPPAVHASPADRSDSPETNQSSGTPRDMPASRKSSDPDA